MTELRSEPHTGNGRGRWPFVAIGVLGVLVVVLAATTALGFGRPDESAAARAEVVRLRSQVAAQAGQLQAARSCIAGYEAQRKEQADAVDEAEDAVKDVQDALGKLARFDLGGATSLVTRAGGRMADASRRLATADRSTPQDCTAFVQ